MKEKVLEKDEYNEISIEGKTYFYKHVGEGKKDLEILNEMGNIPSKNIIDNVKEYIFNKTFKRKIDDKYKKELKKRVDIYCR